MLDGTVKWSTMSRSRWAGSPSTNWRSSAAEAGASVRPLPSWPAARNRPSTPGTGPTQGVPACSRVGGQPKQGWEAKQFSSWLPHHAQCTQPSQASPAAIQLLATHAMHPLTAAHGRGPERTLMSCRFTAPSAGTKSAARCMMASTTASSPSRPNPQNSRLLPTSSVPDAEVVVVKVMSRPLSAAGWPLLLELAWE